MEEVVVISKNDLREYAKKLRRNIQDKEMKDKIILKKVLGNENVQKAKNILIYVSLDYEVDTKNLIKEFLKNKNVYVPRIENQDIKFYKIKSFKDLTRGSFNILEPTTNHIFSNNKESVIIVPGLLFDKNNNRLGYGKGYYDRFLENNNLYKIGLTYSELLIDELEVEDFDIKMNEVIEER